MPDTKLITEFIATEYQLTGSLSPLDSYIDKNYLFVSDCGRKFVVKIAASSSSKAEVILENDAMLHLMKKNLDVTTPELMENINGQSLLSFDDGGQNKLFRLVSWLEGSLYSQVTTPNHALHFSLGHLVGLMTKGLADFQQESAKRSLNWDIAQLASLETNLNYFSGEQYQQLKRHFDQFITNDLQTLQSLPQQIIHNDANDNNLIVQQQSDNWLCTGIFDFGDLVYSQRICDLAVAMTYALFGVEDVFKASNSIVAGYRQALPEIINAEIEMLLALIKARLVQSLLNSGKSIAKDPENQYLLISAKPAWQLLNKLEGVSDQEFIQATTT